MFAGILQMKKPNNYDNTIALVTGLFISTISAWFSIIGLTTIFPAAFWSIVVMGSSLEIGKIITAAYLYRNWNDMQIVMKYYMTAAVIVLMMITSIGAFGYLSKSHMDQSLVSGSVQGKIAIYDEQIKTEKENIEANRKQLRQMDEAVDQIMGRSTDERGANNATNIRRTQGKDRVRIASEIKESQKNILKLNEDRAPIAAEVRKVESEVGPIKYIAKFMYGDKIDENILEKSVSWIIIMLVLVFDPLALLLIMSATKPQEAVVSSTKYDREARAWLRSKANAVATDGMIWKDQEVIVTKK